LAHVIEGRGKISPGKLSEAQFHHRIRGMLSALGGHEKRGRGWIQLTTHCSARGRFFGMRRTKRDYASLRRKRLDDR